MFTKTRNRWRFVGVASLAVLGLALKLVADEQNPPPDLPDAISPLKNTGKPDSADLSALLREVRDLRAEVAELKQEVRRLAGTHSVTVLPTYAPTVRFAEGFLTEPAPAGGNRQEINGIPFYFLPLGGLSSSTTPMFPAIDRPNFTDR